MNKRLLVGLALTALSAGASAQSSVGSTAPSFPTNQAGEVTWVCAGVGADEREAFAKSEPGTNLKLVFAAGKLGEYLASVDVVLVNQAGKRTPIHFTADAPICLISAPAGRYRVEASFRNAKRSMTTTAVKDAKRPTTLVFRFAEAS